MGDVKHPASVLKLTTMDDLRLYFDPVRQRILRALADEPGTVQSVAETLGVPFKRLYYQFNLLEKAGFIRVTRVQPYPGAVDEKYYQTVAQVVWVDDALLRLDTAEQDGLGTVLSAVLDETKADIRRSVLSGKIDLQVANNPDNPHISQLRLERLIVRMNAEEAGLLYQKIMQLIDETVAQSSASSAEQHSITLAVYPTSLMEGQEL